MALYRIRDLTFTYPEQPAPALENIDFALSEGDFALLIGPSGCGKTTLLKLLKPELAPHGTLSGAIEYDGAPLADLDPRRSAAQIAFVTQDPEAQIVTDTVWHELAFGAESLGLPQDQIRRAVAEIASYFGIEPIFRQKTAALSGGEKQLVNLAAAMVMRPRLLILDEPTAQLDPIAAAEFIRTVARLNRELGLTVLMAEHRLEDLFPAADSVTLLEKGRVTASGTPADVCAALSDAHPMSAALPAAARIFRMTGGTGETPLSVREGRKYVQAFPPRAYEAPVREAPAGPALACKDVFFRYEKNAPDVLRGATLTLHQSEHLCLLGGNGAGKSTLLAVLAGLIKPLRGKVKGNSARIALLPQDPKTLFIEKTVEADLDAVCALAGADQERKAALVERFRLTGLLSRHPYDLSGGEQQRAAFVKLLLTDPNVLLLDEPTKGLDAPARKELAAYLAELQAKSVSILTVTHDVEFALCAQSCALLFDGEILTAADTRTFLTRNRFYTTAACRIGEGHFPGAVRAAEIAACCKGETP